MRIAVVGATGLVGRLVTQVLIGQGHEPVALARSVGTDLLTGHGVANALSGVEAIIDVLNTEETDAAGAESFFSATTSNIQSAAVEAGVSHLVTLSIVNVDLVQENGHYAGKRRQEQLTRSGSVPWSILRATQFFDFAEQAVAWTTYDGVAAVPPLLMQPVAVADVAEVLVEIATGPANRTITELAGPDPQDLVDMSRRVLAARHSTTRLRPSWHNGVFGLEFAGDVMLPSASVRIGPTTFDQWLQDLSMNH